MKITDTYKAAYFMTRGAELVAVEIKYQPDLLRNHTWICVLDGVTEEMKLDWQTRNAVINVDDFRRERDRIKRMVRRMKI